MSLQMFLNNFALLADAPNGVAKLRELILHLAVHGQLHTQNRDDTSPSALIRQIQLHKARLIKDKQIRNSKPLPTIESNEILFNIPKTWQWVRLGEIGDWGAGATPDRKNPKYYVGNIRWFKSGELNDGYIYESEETITDLALKTCSLRLNKPGDVLIAMYGATIGKLAILKTEATTNQAVCACTCFDGFYNQFLFTLLRAYKTQFTGRGAGGAQPNISREKIIHTVVPLPPLEEQKRIVAKVDELMRLCDELEARQQAKRKSRVRLNNASLAPLNKVASLTCEEFKQATTRLVYNFDSLYDSTDTVAELRSTILQLAADGKLVPQDRNDEPASVLLANIHTLKEEIVQTRRIKAGTRLADITTGATLPPLPVGWQWTTLDDVLISLRNGISVPPQNFGNTKLLRISALRPNLVNINEFRYLLESPESYEEFKVDTGDLLFTRYSGNRDFVGICGVVPQHDEPLIHPDKLIRGRLIPGGLCPEFISIVMNTGVSRSFVEARLKTTAGQVGVAGRELKMTPIPVAPLEEQKRIVAKVNQLMGLCDELESKLRKAEADSEKLMNAAVQHVLRTVTGCG